MMLTSIISEIDVEIEKIHRLISAAANADDPELACGLATRQDMSSIQREIDLAAGACETLDAHVRAIMRGR